MNINTWSSFSKRRNSTKQPTGGTQKTVTLKSPTSIINPVFLLESFSLSDNYLQWGNRYYFIDDIILVNNSLAEYHCSVDALASWKSSIGSMNEYVVRAASSYNPSIVDMLYPARADITVSNVSFDPMSISGQTGCYIVGLVSAESNPSGSVSYYALSASDFTALLQFMFDGTWLDQNETDLAVITQKELVNPFQYVVSCFWLPYTVSGSSATMKFGYWDSGINASLISPAMRNAYFSSQNIALPAHPEAASRGNYLNGFPFTRRTLFCYGFGQIPLDSSYYVTTQSIDVIVEVDNFTGGGKLTVTNPAGTQIGQYAGQVGVNVPLAQMSQSLAAPVSDVVGGALGMLSGNFAGFISGIGNAIHDMQPKLQTSGTMGTSVDYTYSPHIVSEFRYQTPMDATHNGRPLCQNTTIGNLSGYVKTENVDVDLPCTQAERDMIASYMDGGFYYE